MVVRDQLQSRMHWMALMPHSLGSMSPKLLVQQLLMATYPLAAGPTDRAAAVQLDPQPAVWVLPTLPHWPEPPMIAAAAVSVTAGVATPRYAETPAAER